MELIRLLMLNLESENGEKADLSGYSEEQIGYHAALLVEAGLAKGDISEDNDGFPTGAVLICPTWAGHEFLDAAKNSDLWHRTTQAIKQAGVAVTLPVLIELLTMYAKEKLGLK